MYIRLSNLTFRIREDLAYYDLEILILLIMQNIYSHFPELVTVDAIRRSFWIYACLFTLC
jgi:hypothetical protein